MRKATADPSREFFDVFISYRHLDVGRIEELKQKMQSHGYSCFQDLELPSFQDTIDVTREKVERLRSILSRSTCLIFAYSRNTAEKEKKEDSPVAFECQNPSCSCGDLGRSYARSSFEWRSR